MNNSIRAAQIYVKNSVFVQIRQKNSKIFVNYVTRRSVVVYKFDVVLSFCKMYNIKYGWNPHLRVLLPRHEI